MDWFLYDNCLRYERVNSLVKLRNDGTKKNSYSLLLFQFQ